MFNFEDIEKDVEYAVLVGKHKDGRRFIFSLGSLDEMDLAACGKYIDAVAGKLLADTIETNSGREEA